MSGNYFKFKKFTVHQEHAPFKVTTDSVLLGAWADFRGAKNILDIGAGTGILSLMAAQRSGAQIVALEPDAGSFMQAGLNICASPWPGQDHPPEYSCSGLLSRQRPVVRYHHYKPSLFC